MTYNWNGSDLQTEFAATLGDTTDAFKARVLAWMNDVQDDICNQYQWGFLKKTATKTLSASTELQNLYIDDPSSAATATLNASGSLTSGSTYTFKITFYRSTDDYESIPSSASNTITCTAGNQQIALSSIPTSSETTVTARKVYVSKDSGTYVLAGTISDNTTTTYTYSTNTTSTYQPPDYHGMKMVVGNLYLVDSNRQLRHRTEDDLRLIFPGDWSDDTGTPEFWSSRSHTSALFYPVPSASTTLKFTYIKIPKRIFAESDSQPDIPIWMKNVMEAGVLWKGYQYRERPLAVNYMQRYQQLLELAISTSAKTKTGAGRVRDVVGSSRGTIF